MPRIMTLDHRDQPLRTSVELASIPEQSVLSKSAYTVLQDHLSTPINTRPFVCLFGSRMACISASSCAPSSSSSFYNPDQALRKSLSKCAGFLSPPPCIPIPPASRFSHSCRCSKSRSDSPSPYDDFIRPPLDSLQDAARGAIRWWNDFLGSHRGRAKDGDAADAAAGDEKVTENKGGDWDWDRWRLHFQEVEEQERIVSVLKVIIKLVASF